MTNREAIFLLKTLQKEHTGKWDLKAFDMAIAALEKQEPMKPRLNYKPSKVARKIFNDENGYTCTHCGNVCLKRCSATRNETFYCWNCGQKLDWTEGAE